MQSGRNTRKLLKREKYSEKKNESNAKNDVESQKTLDMHLIIQILSRLKLYGL